MKKIFVPYKDDKRMIYAIEYLTAHGYTQTVDKSSADFVLLPIPVKKYMLSDLDNKIVFYGSGDYTGIDYNKDKEFLLKNAFFTAEGAVALFEDNCDISLFGANALIVGYGRIAKALHKALKAFSSNVTVCSRSELSKLQAKANNAVSIDFSQLKEKRNYDVVFNTVPAVVFTKPEIDALNKDTLFIDLASFPGGIDTHYAKHKDLKIIDGRGLPSIYCVKSAGYLIGETVARLFEEGLN